MKAVIVDIRGKHAAALDESGSVIRIPNADYTVGQKIELHEVPRIRTGVRRRFATVAAVAVLILGLGTGTAYAVPYGTVSLEATPSIEYKINCFNYVLDVTAENEEAETVLSEVGKKNLRHRPIAKAIETTVEQIRQDGYLEEEDSRPQIRAGGRTERHTERLQKKLDADLMRDSPSPRKGEADRAEPAEPGKAPEHPSGMEKPGMQNQISHSKTWMNVDYKADDVSPQSATAENSKCNSCTLEELAVLRVIAANTTITQKDLTAMIGRSERTVKTRTVALQEKGCLRRVNGKRSGHWEVLIEIS